MEIGGKIAYIYETPGGVVINRLGDGDLGLSGIIYMYKI